MTDHDLLQRVDEKLDDLAEQFKNHLKHHFLVTLLALGSAFTTISALIVFILTK